MSLKGGNLESPSKQTKEFLDAVEDLKNGKRNAKRKLYRLVKNGKISIQDYEELIEKYKKEIYLFGYPIKDYRPIATFFSVITAISIILSTIENPNFWESISLLYLGLSFFLYHYSNSTDKQDKDTEIAQLKQEIRRLESCRKSDKHIIELLEKELERANNNSQQN